MARPWRAVVLVTALGAAGCSGEGPAISGAGTSLVPTTVAPATPSADRNDPMAVGAAFITAWRSRDGARMQQLARSSFVVEIAMRLPAEPGDIVCIPRDAVWQCTIGASRTPLYIMLDRNPTWAVYHVGESHGDVAP